MFINEMLNIDVQPLRSNMAASACQLNFYTPHRVWRRLLQSHDSSDLERLIWKHSDGG